MHECVFIVEKMAPFAVLFCHRSCNCILVITRFVFIQAAEYSGVTDAARRLLGSMNRRDARQKFTAIFILVILIVVIVVFVYYSR